MTNPSTDLAVREFAETVEAVPVRPLAELATVIKDGHCAAEDALRAWLDNAVCVGRALTEARPQVPRGEWARWCAGRGISVQQANIYVRVAVHEEALRAADALTGTDAKAFLKANNLGSGFSRGGATSTPKQPEIRAKAVDLVRNHGVATKDVAALLGISQSVIYTWLDPEGTRRRLGTARQSRRDRRHAQATARAAELEQRQRDAAREIGGDFDKAYEYATKLDQILGRAREQADTKQRRLAINEAHKHRDRMMAALIRAL